MAHKRCARWVFLVMAAGALAVAGCQDKQPGAARPGQPPAATPPAAAAAGVAAVNASCPIMGGKLSDPAHVKPELTRTYNGQTVGFCCDGCPGMWDKLTDAQKAEALAKAMAAR